MRSSTRASTTTGPTLAVRTAAGPVERYAGDVARALGDVKGWLGDGWRVVLVTEGHGPAERLVEQLGDEGVPARLDADLPAAPDRAVVHVSTGGIDTGFLAPGLRLAVLTESDLAGQRSSTKEMRRMPSRRRNTVDPLQLKTGDFVVHEQHGVGRYVEMMQRTVQNATREYLVIEYAPSKRGQPGDRSFVPTDRSTRSRRYVGGEHPSLDRLGGADWAKRKGPAPASREADRGRAHPALLRPHGQRGLRLLPRTRRGSASSRTPSPTSRPRTSSPRIDEVKLDMERSGAHGPRRLR
jgi:transcription-repair coupling factor (superfamily II helicase)